MAFLKNVHLAFVGFEIERVVAPFKESKGDRIYLFTRTNDKDGNPYLEKIREQIGKKKVIVIETDHKDVFKQVNAAIKVIRKEKDSNLFFNLSSGSKLNAMALFLATMYTSEVGKTMTAYYAEMKVYASRDKRKQKRPEPKEDTYEYKGIISVPIFSLQKPSDDQVRLLEIIGEGIRKPVLLGKAIDEGLFETSKDKSNPSKYMALRNKLLDPLEKTWNAVKEEGKRNKKISLTEKGKTLLQMLKSEK